MPETQTSPKRVRICQFGTLQPAKTQTFQHGDDDANDDDDNDDDDDDEDDDNDHDNGGTPLVDVSVTDNASSPLMPTRAKVVCFLLTAYSTARAQAPPSSPPPSSPRG